MIVSKKEAERILGKPLKSLGDLKARDKGKRSYYVLSESGKNMGGPYDMAGAKERLRQVEAFKHMKRNPDVQSGRITDDMALLVSERTGIVSLSLFDCGGFKRAVKEAMQPIDIVHNYDEFMIGFIAGMTAKDLTLFVEEPEANGGAWSYLTGDKDRKGELVSVEVDVVEVVESVARAGYGKLMYELLMSWAVDHFEGIMPARGEPMDAGTKAIWDSLEKDEGVVTEPWGAGRYQKIYRRKKPLKEFYPLQVSATVTLLSAARKFPGSLMDLQRLFFVAADNMITHGITQE